MAFLLMLTVYSHITRGVHEEFPRRGWQVEKIKEMIRKNMSMITSRTKHFLHDNSQISIENFQRIRTHKFP